MQFIHDMMLSGSFKLLAVYACKRTILQLQTAPATSIAFIPATATVFLIVCSYTCALLNQFAAVAAVP
jgi:ureidoglycolate hydrolase